MTIYLFECVRSVTNTESIPGKYKGIMVIDMEHISIIAKDDLEDWLDSHVTDGDGTLRIYSLDIVNGELVVKWRIE